MDNFQQRHSLGLFYKYVSIVILIAFLCQNIAWSGPTPITLHITHPTSHNIHIPEDYGSIIKKCDSGQKDKFIILIHDAHCHYEAQHNISKILEIMVRDYGVNLVCIEGAEGRIDTSAFQSFPYEDIRKKAVDKYMKRGVLSGSEALSISKALDLPFALWGVEDNKLYIDDFKAFRKTMTHSNEAEFFIANLKRVINLLKPNIYSKELLQFDEKLNEYTENKLSLSDWVKYIRNQKPDPRHAWVPRSNQRNFNLVVKSLALEEKIDFKSVENERTLLIKELEKTLVKDELEELVKQSLYFKLGKISGLKYYSYLETFIPQEPNRLYNLLNYIELVKLQSEIDPDGLFSELEIITAKTAGSYFCGELDRKLYELSSDCRLLDKLFHLGMSRSELDYYKNQKEKFRIDKLLSFINIQAPLNNIHLPNEFKDPVFLQNVYEFKAPAEEFYELALKRDDALVENLLEKMEEENKHTAIIVTGGFHSQGIEKRLQNKGISHITVSPKITKIQENNPYLRLMLDEDLDIDSIFAKGSSNISLPPLSVQKKPSAELARYLFEQKGKKVSDIRKTIPEELREAFNELVALARVKETQSVDDLLEAIKPENIMVGISNSDFENETHAETGIERLRLALQVAGIADSTPYLEKLLRESSSPILKELIKRMLSEKKGGFIGKYEILGKAVFDEKNGAFRVRVRNIETGEEKEVELKAKRISADIIKEKLQQQFGAIDNQIVRRIIDWFLNSFQGEVFVVEDNLYGIMGIGQKGLIAISNVLLSDPVALFHEIGEAAIDAGIIDINEIINSLQDRGWYDAHMAKDGRENMRAHYALRALQREVFNEEDRELTNKIKLVMNMIQEEQKKQSLRQELISLFSGDSEPLRENRSKAAVIQGGQEIKVFQNGETTKGFLRFLSSLRIKKVRVIKESADGNIKICLIEDQQGNRFLAVLKDGRIERVAVKAYTNLRGDEYFIELKDVAAIRLFGNVWDNYKRPKESKFDEDRFLYTAAFSQEDVERLLNRIAENPILYHIFKMIIEKFPELQLAGGFLLAKQKDAGGYYIAALKMILWQVGYGVPANGLLGHEAMHHIFHEDERLYNILREYIKVNHPKLLKWLQINPLYRHSPDSIQAINEAIAYIVEAIINGTVKIRGFDKLRYGDIRLLKEMWLLPAEYFPDELLSILPEDGELQEGFFYIIKEIYKLRFENQGKEMAEILIAIAGTEMQKEGLNYGALLLIAELLKNMGSPDKAKKIYEQLLDKTEKVGIKAIAILMLIGLGETERVNELMELFKDQKAIRDFVRTAIDLNLNPEGLRGLFLSFTDDNTLQEIFKQVISDIEQEIGIKKQEIQTDSGSLKFLKGKYGIIDEYKELLKLLNELYFVYCLLGDTEKCEAILREIGEIEQKLLEISSEKGILEYFTEESRRKELERLRTTNALEDILGEMDLRNLFQQTGIVGMPGVDKAFEYLGIRDLDVGRWLIPEFRSIQPSYEIKIKLPEITIGQIEESIDETYLPEFNNNSRSKRSTVWAILKTIYNILVDRNYTAKEKSQLISVCLAMLRQTLKGKTSKKDKSAYFGEGSQETINPQIKRILRDETGKDYYCMFGTTDEGRKGSLKEAEQYRDMIEGAMRNLGIEGYDVVVLRGVNFSGHYGRSRRRVYMPVEILEIASQNPEIGQDLIEDFIKHEYLESTGLSHEETMAQCDAELNRKAQKLYRKYIIEKIIEEVKDIKEAKRLRSRLTRILKGYERIEDVSPKDLLLSIEKGKRFELTPKIARLVDLLYDDSYAGERGKKVLLILNEILKLVPEEIVKQVTEEHGLKEYEAEEKLLLTMKKLAQEKGIDPNCIQSVFDLFRQGMDLLTLYPELLDGQVDSAYFDLVEQIEQITGIKSGKIMNIFKKEFRIDARITQGQPVPDSILEREAKKLGLYMDLQERKDYRAGVMVKKLFDLDFENGTIIQDMGNKNPEAVQYLSEQDTVSKDIRAVYQGLHRGAKGIMENSQPTMLYYHADAYIDLDEIEVEDLGDGRLGIKFSHQPGLRAFLSQLARIDNGKGLVRIALGASGIRKDGRSKREILERIIEAAGLKERVIVIDEIKTSEEIESFAERFKGDNTVFINYADKISKEEARKAAERGIRIFGVDSSSSFHASLLFGVMYARAKTMDDIRTVVSSLNLFGVSEHEIKEILDQLEKGVLYFTVKLIRIKDTINNFRNHKLYTEVAA